MDGWKLDKDVLFSLHIKNGVSNAQVLKTKQIKKNNKCLVSTSILKYAYWELYFFFNGTKRRPID